MLGHVTHTSQKARLLFEVKSRCEVMRLTFPPKRVCVCTYVVGGRVGMNDTCHFSFDM